MSSRVLAIVQDRLPRNYTGIQHFIALTLADWSDAYGNVFTTPRQVGVGARVQPKVTERYLQQMQDDGFLHVQPDPVQGIRHLKLNLGKFVGNRPTGEIGVFPDPVPEPERGDGDGGACAFSGWA